MGWIHSRLQRRTTIRKEFLMSHIAVLGSEMVTACRYVTLQKLIAWLTPMLIGSRPLLIMANPFLTCSCLIVIDCMQLHNTFLGYDVILARGSSHATMDTVSLLVSCNHNIIDVMCTRNTVKHWTDQLATFS